MVLLCLYAVLTRYLCSGGVYPRLECGAGFTWARV